MIPESVESIGNYAFYGCTGLDEIVIYGDEFVIEISSYTFGTLPVDCVIYIPAAIYSDYVSDTYWGNYSAYMVSYSSLDDLPYNYANELLYIDPDRLYNLYGNAS